MLRNLTQLAPACITFVAAIFLSKSCLELKSERLLWRVQDSLAIVEGMSHQRADTIVGTILLFAAFIWQMINLARPAIWLDLAGISGTELSVTLVLTMSLFVTCYYLSNHLGRRIYLRVLADLKKEPEGSTES